VLFAIDAAEKLNEHREKGHGSPRRPAQSRATRPIPY
jgi:hypothetical protein